VSNKERQKALEAKGYTFHRRNSKRKWVRYTSNSRRFSRFRDILERESP
jgi:hypothetical protein